MKVDRADWCMECGAATRKADDGKSAECPKCGARFEQIVGPVWGKRRRQPTQVQRDIEQTQEAWRNLGDALMETWPFRTIERFVRWLSRNRNA